jgi:hypothetical protein
MGVERDGGPFRLDFQLVAMVDAVPYRIVLKAFRPGVSEAERAAAYARIRGLASIRGVVRVETEMQVIGTVSRPVTECTIIEFKDGAARERYLADDRFRLVQEEVSPMLESSEVIDVGSPAKDDVSVPGVPWGILAS